MSKQFTVAADEVWRLQNGSDPECKHFQKIADVGHYRAHKSTRQGTYIATPSGILLGSMNTHNSSAVLKMMRECLEKYSAMDREERLLAANAKIKPTTRPERNFPDNGLDLTMVARDLPTSGDPSEERSAAWNQDRVWFSKDEMRSMLPKELSALKVGDSFELPPPIVNRIARFSIIDTAKGQTSYYSVDEVADSQVSATVEAIDAKSIRLALAGTTAAMSPDSRGRDFPHGVKTELLGHAVFDRLKSGFTELEIVAIGSRWGRTVFNGRQRQLDETPIGFVFRITPPNAPLVAPSFLFAYQAGWAHKK